MDDITTCSLVKQLYDHHILNFKTQVSGFIVVLYFFYFNWILKFPSDVCGSIKPISLEINTPLCSGQGCACSIVANATCAHNVACFGLWSEQGVPPARHGGSPIARWLVYFMENPSLKWMMTGGNAYFQTPPVSCCFFTMDYDWFFSWGYLKKISWGYLGISCSDKVD